MRVISFINGSLISQTASIYALYYAKQREVALDLVYIESKDDFAQVQRSSKSIEAVAQKLEVDIDFQHFQNGNAFLVAFLNKEIDMMFCSTRHDHSIFDRSFVQTLLKWNLPSDLAVVKVVNLGVAEKVDKIILPLRGSKLSIQKFSFFTLNTLAYDAKAEIYSVDKVTKNRLSKIDSEMIKTQLQKLLFALRHYVRLAKIMGFKFTIRHEFALLEDESIENHIVRKNFDLAIVGGHHDKSFFGNHPIDILFERPMINTIYFIPYKDL